MRYAGCEMRAAELRYSGCGIGNIYYRNYNIIDFESVLRFCIVSVSHYLDINLSCNCDSNVKCYMNLFIY